MKGLVRQQSYSFLEYFEESGIHTIKQVIKVSQYTNCITQCDVPHSADKFLLKFKYY